jgi:hypothetical protein
VGAQMGTTNETDTASDGPLAIFDQEFRLVRVVVRGGSNRRPSAFQEEVCQQVRPPTTARRAIGVQFSA